MTREKFRSYVGWSGSAALIIGFVLGWPKLLAIGFIMVASWYLALLSFLLF